MTVNIVLYFVNKIMMSNLTSTFLLFTLGNFLFSGGIIKADHFRVTGPCTREGEGRLESGNPKCATSSGTTAPSWQLEGPPGVGRRGTVPGQQGRLRLNAARPPPPTRIPFPPATP